MRRISIIALALLLTSTLTLPALGLTSISGPSNVQVPYGGCTTATWSSTSTSLDTYEWSWNSTIVGNSSSYSRTFCSPLLDVYSKDYATLDLYTTDNGTSDFDSLSVTIHYEGRCGTQIFC